ncbi:MAG TPA: tetratricopeptide repeat protein [Planctomycetaceae bacterium]|nr:tetratricopeptide repeat protein [Planctomycetaceae bacterium]
MTLLAIVVAAPCLYFWYRYQVNRQATALMDRARKLYDEKDWNQAAALLHQFLQLRPDDPQYAPQATLLRAQAFDKTAVDRDRKKRAVSLYFQAVEANPGDNDAALRLAELLFETTRFEEAALKARELLTVLPDDVRPARLLAASLRVQVGPTKRVTAASVVKEFETLLARHPGDVPLSMGLANLLRGSLDDLPEAIRERAIATADETVDQMVSQHPDDVEALLARYQYRTTNQLADTGHDLERARQLSPDNVEQLLISAVTAADSDREAAKKYGERLLEVAPDDRRVYLTLATLHARWNEPQSSIAVLRRGLDHLGKEDLDLNRSLLKFELSVGDTAATRPVLDLLRDLVGRLGPYMQAPARRRLSEEVEVARAELALLEKKGDQVLRDALPTLKRLAAGVTEGTDVAENLFEQERRWRLLATAYSQSGLHDLAAAAGDELVRLNPSSKPYRLLAAGEWRASGELDRALRHLESASLGEPQLAAVWLQLAEIRLDEQLRKPAGRDWSGVDAALQEARKLSKDSPGPEFIAVTLAMAKNDRPTAVDLLQKLAASPSVEATQLPRLITLLDVAGESDLADQTLARYRDSHKDLRAVAMTESELLRRRGKIADAVKVLDEAAAQSAGPDREVILQRLIATEIDAGNMKSARRRLHALHKEKIPDDVQQLSPEKIRRLAIPAPWFYDTAADLALMAGDLDELHVYEFELKAFDESGSLGGPIGALWRYFRAIRLLEKNRGNRQPDLGEARRLLTEIETLRPSWPQIWLLRGRIAEELKNGPEAAKDFEAAYHAGARSLTGFQWLVTSLYRENRFADAAVYIRQAGQIATFSGTLSSLAVPAALRAGRIQDALGVARAAAELRADDPVAQVVYAQALALANDSPAAEEKFKRAVELNPKDVRTWSGLVWFYGRERRQDEARQALDKLVATVEFTPLNRKLVLARGFDLIGDRAAAEKQYQDALAERSDDPRLLEEVGRFYARFNQEKSLELYQQALKLDPKSSVARRAIAAVWGLRGSEADWNRAVELLQNDSASGQTLDRRLEATLLLIQGGEANSQKAVSVLSGLLAAEERPNPTDRLLLAKGYEDLNKLDEAEAEITAAVTGNPDPSLLALFVDFLLRHRRLDRADEWLNRLAEREPENPRSLMLRVRWLEAADRAGEIEPAVDSFVTQKLEAAKTDEQKSQILRFAADVLSRAKQYAAAEKKLNDASNLTDDGYGTLATWLAERGRFDEALAVWRDRIPASATATRVGTAVRIMTVIFGRGMDAPPGLSELEQVLDDAAQPADASPQLLMEIGVCWVMRSRNDRAIALYEKALAREPQSLPVINNLALVLAETPGQHERALQLIDSTLASSPANLELLDSKAQVLIGIDRPAEAREILDRICRLNAKNPHYRLHLAMALYQLKDLPGARRELEQARSDNLDQELLTPSERRLLQQITSEQAVKKGVRPSRNIDLARTLLTLGRV